MRHQTEDPLHSAQSGSAGADVGFLEEGKHIAHKGGEVTPEPTGLLEQRHTTGGQDGGGRAKEKKIYIHFIAISPIEGTFCRGYVCQGLLIQFVPLVLFLNLSTDFIPGML